MKCEKGKNQASKNWRRPGGFSKYHPTSNHPSISPFSAQGLGPHHIPGENGFNLDKTGISYYMPMCQINGQDITWFEVLCTEIHMWYNFIPSGMDIQLYDQV